MARERVLLKLTKRYGKWNPGEVAAFTPKTAEDLVNKEAATKYDAGAGPGVPVSKNGHPPAVGDEPDEGQEKDKETASSKEGGDPKEGKDPKEDGGDSGKGTQKGAKGTQNKGTPKGAQNKGA